MTGGPRVLLNLLEQLGPRGVIPLVLLPEEAPITRELTRMGVEWRIEKPPGLLLSKEGKALRYGFIDKLKSLGALFRYNRRIQAICARESISVVWTRNLKGVLMTAAGARWAGRPVIWDVGMETNSAGLVKVLHTLGLILVNRVVLEGDSQHRQIFGSLQSVFGHKMTTLNPGISPARIHEIRKALTEAAVSNKVLKLISIGSIIPRKNQHELIEVARLLTKQGCRVTLSVIGPAVDEEYHRRILRDIERYALGGVVHMLGWRTDVADLLAEADVLVSSSLNEGIPYVMHEAMHAELPIVAYPAGGIPDAITDQETGLLVPDNSPEALAAAILRLSQDEALRRKMGDRARKRAVEQFSAVTWGERYTQLLNHISTA